jgi:hypothetical protein
LLGKFIYGFMRPVDITPRKFLGSLLESDFWN